MDREPGDLRTDGDLARGEAVTIRGDGRALAAYAGETVAAALWAAGWLFRPDVSARPATYTPQQIRDEVKRLKDQMGRGGGYILEAGITIQADVTLENVLALIDQAQKPD